MDSNQEAKVSMYLKVQQFVANHLAALTALFSIITDYKTDLDNFLTDIFEADAIATADNTGHTEAKQAKRDELTTLAVRISGGGAAYYKGQGDSGKQNEIYFGLSEFTRAKDTVVYTYAMQVHRLANAAGAALAPHGITVGDISNLNLKAQQYLAIVQLPQGKRSEKVAQGKKVDTLMKETDDFLDETLDPQMRVMKGTANQELLDEYESNRLIDDAHSGGGGGGLTDVTRQGDLGATVSTSPSTEDLTETDTTTVSGSTPTPGATFQIYSGTTVSDPPSGSIITLTDTTPFELSIAAFKAAIGLNETRPFIIIKNNGTGTAHWVLVFGDVIEG